MAMPIWLDRLKSDKSRTVREACALCLGIALQEWTEQGYLTAQIWDQVGTSLVKALRDSAPGVRSNAKRSMETLCTMNRDVFDKLFENAELTRDARVRKLLIRIQSGETVGDDVSVASSRVGSVASRSYHHRATGASSSVRHGQSQSSVRDRENNNNYKPNDSNRSRLPSNRGIPTTVGVESPPEFLEGTIPSPTPDNDLVFSKAMTKVSLDGKAGVPIGEPGYPVRTNVRKFSASIIATKDRNKATAGDHNWHKANVVPSMALFICTPAEPHYSWRVGRVTCSIKDRATEHSTAMRHSVEFVNQVKFLVAKDDGILATGMGSDAMPESTSMPFTMVLRADGGSDRNPKNASVVIGSLHTFLRLNLDVLVVLVAAADISHVNEVEGVMPMVNLGLQNQAFEGHPMSERFEQLFKNANSGKMIRAVIAKQPTPDGQEACQNAWRGSVEVPRRTIATRISQAEYTQHAVEICEPASDSAVNEAFAYLIEKLDPEIHPKITTWADVRKKNPDLCKFVESHATIERYHLEIKKCGDDDCKSCQAVRMPKALWEELKKRPRVVPSPTPDTAWNPKSHDGAVKYLDYYNVKYSHTSPGHRPSYKPPSIPKAMERFDKTLSETTRPLHLSKNASGKFRPICAHCGCEDNHVPTQEVEVTTEGQKGYSICRNCLDENKKPLVYGQKIKTRNNNPSRKRAQSTDRGSNSKKKKKADTPIPSWASNELKLPTAEGSATPQTSIPKTGSHFDPKASSHREEHQILPLLRRRPRWFIGESLLQKFEFKEEIERFGKIEDVAPDGNCGFYAILVGLEKIEKIGPQESVTEFQKDLL